MWDTRIWPCQSWEALRPGGFSASGRWQVPAWEVNRGGTQDRDAEQRHRAGTWDKDAASQPPSLADPKEPQRPLAHECLGETLRILRQVISKYPLLNTLETLTAAGTLISKVKGETVGLGTLSHSFPAPQWDGGGTGELSPMEGLPGCPKDWWRGQKHRLPLAVVQL